MSDLDQIARIRLELQFRPEIWRRVEVPLTTSLKVLHEVFQAALLFENRHLFRFDVGAKRYGIPDPEFEFEPRILQAKGVKIGALLERGARSFTYLYDFGDDWCFTVQVEAIAPAAQRTEYPRFVDGAGRAPPEDVGGIPSFEEFLEAMADRKHGEHERLREWYGRGFDPDDISSPDIKAQMRVLARRREAGRAAFQKSRTPMH